MAKKKKGKGKGGNSFTPMIVGASKAASKKALRGAAQASQKGKATRSYIQAGGGR